MPLRRLHTRLLLAVIIPLVMVSAMLFPIFNVHMEMRLDSLRAKADDVLKIGQEALTHDISESINYTLAIAETPGIRQYLTVQSLPSLSDQQYALSDISQLSHFLNTLISHYELSSVLVYGGQ